MPAAKQQEDFLDRNDTVGQQTKNQSLRFQWAKLVFSLIVLAIVGNLVRARVASVNSYLITPYDRSSFDSFDRIDVVQIQNHAFTPVSYQKSDAQARNQPLQDICDRIQKTESLPALWLAYSRKADGGRPNIAAAGVLKIGDKAAATPDNLVHIGSCTKAMTAVLIGLLVEKRKLKWEQSIVESFPKLKDKIHPDYHDVTLEQLLQHRGKIPANASDWWINQSQPVIERRLSIISANLQKEPPKVPKDGYRYSNLGYMIAGAMAEQATGKAWEKLLEEELFRPLKITSAGFGSPGRKGRVDQPWGHTYDKDGNWRPVQGDNAAALGPAGTVHLSIADWIRFAEVFFPDSPQKLISKETLLKLTMPASSNGYAMGWGTVRWNDDILELVHSGSNTMWYATIVVDRKNQLTFVAVTNGHRERIEAVLEKAIEEVRALK
jgi:CubicO group peptidase (beta-lactamase class C family)